MTIPSAADVLDAAVSRLIKAARAVRTPDNTAFAPPPLDQLVPLFHELEAAFSSIAQPLGLPVDASSELRAWQCRRIQEEAGALAAIIAALGSDRLVLSPDGSAIQFDASPIPGPGSSNVEADPKKVVHLRPLDAARREFRAAFLAARAAGGAVTWQESPWEASQEQRELTAALYAQSLTYWITSGVAGEAHLLFLARRLLFGLIETQICPPPAALPVHVGLVLLLRAIPFPRPPRPSDDGDQRAAIFLNMR